MLDKVFSVLSVGQMQLIALIRGLLEQPKVLLLDEALNNIDQNKIEIIASYLEIFAKSNDRIVILCSHTICQSILLKRCNWDEAILGGTTKKRFFFGHIATRSHFLDNSLASC